MRQKRERRSVMFDLLRRTCGCIDCGTREGTLEFDHRDPAEREFKISGGYAGKGCAAPAVRRDCEVRCSLRGLPSAAPQRGPSWTCQRNEKRPPCVGVSPASARERDHRGRRGLAYPGFRPALTAARATPSPGREPPRGGSRAALSQSGSRPIRRNEKRSGRSSSGTGRLGM